VRDKHSGSTRGTYYTCGKCGSPCTVNALHACKDEEVSERGDNTGSESERSGELADDEYSDDTSLAESESESEETAPRKESPAAKAADSEAVARTDTIPSGHEEFHVPEFWQNNRKTKGTSRSHQ